MGHARRKRGLRSVQKRFSQAAHQGAFLRVPHGWRLFKLLLHYDWAWWRTLGLLDGPFEVSPRPVQPPNQAALNS